MGLEESLGAMTMVEEAGTEDREELPSGERESRFGVTLAVVLLSCFLPSVAVIKVEVVVVEVAVGV